jgi:hypothetical protein
MVEDELRSAPRVSDDKRRDMMRALQADAAMRERDSAVGHGEVPMAESSGSVLASSGGVDDDSDDDCGDSAPVDDIPQDVLDRLRALAAGDADIPLDALPPSLRREFEKAVADGSLSAAVPGVCWRRASMCVCVVSSACMQCLRSDDDCGHDDGDDGGDRDDDGDACRSVAAVVAG